MRILIAVCTLLPLVYSANYGDRWQDDENTILDETDGSEQKEVESSRPLPNAPRPNSSNLGCFLCTQLLSVTKHRVGLSQNQLRNVLYEKCRVLPQMLKDQCFTFVDRSLPEIYFSLNYDFSSQDVCVTLNFCEADNPFAVATPPDSEETTKQVEQETTPLPNPSTPFPSMPTLVPTVDDRISVKARPLPNRGERVVEKSDRIGHRNFEKEMEEKRLTCKFCERMLENAKTYAVTAKTDITSFANTACGNLPKGRFADQCYKMADKKIEELAKFVDHQVIEALWCAELNHC